MTATTRPAHGRRPVWLATALLAAVLLAGPAAVPLHAQSTAPQDTPSAAAAPAQPQPPPAAPPKPPAPAAPKSPAAAQSAAPAQSATPNIAELRQVIAVRDAQGGGNPAETVAAAQAYLKDFPQGRYADEVLLALAQARAASEQPKEALAAYDRLITEHRDSPFREQAMTESLPLLQAAGEQAAAFERVDALVKGYPNSLQRSPALLWKAQTLEAQDDHAGALATLERIDPQQDLPAEREADYYRLQTLALVRSGQSAWTPLQRYLKRDDTPEHKAEVLMLVGGIAREAGRPDEALRYYRQVVEDYPVPERLAEALYWRAALFDRTRLGDAPQEVADARRETAIGYYAAYLENGDEAHRAEALLARGALQRDAGRLEPALADYEQAVALDESLGRKPEVVRARVQLYQQVGRPEQAVALLEAARNDDALTPDERTAFQVQLASLHYDAQRCEQVEGLLDPMPVIADASLRSRAFFMRGFCRYRQGQWEKATFDLEGLINDPKYQELALEPLLDAYEKSGQTSRLVHLTEELLNAKRVQPTAPLMRRLANGYDKLGEPALMLSAYQRLEAAHPEAVQAPDIQLQMGLANEKLKRHDAAIAHYRAVLEREPPAEPAPPEVYLEALAHLQALYIADGKLDEVEALHAAAAKAITEPEHQARLAGLRQEADLALARHDLEADQPKAAVPRLEAALKQTPVDETARRAPVAALLMVAYARSGKPEQGRALYDAERKAHPDDGYRPLLATAVLDTAQGPPEAHADPAQRAALIPLYKQALEDLPHEQTQARYEATQMLDGLYKAEGNHAARAALITALLKDGYDDETKRELRLYQAQVYKDWGQALLDKGDAKGAQFQLERAMELVADADWRRRYEIAAVLSRVQLQQQRYSDLVVMNEALLPEIEDAALAAQVRHFLGQVYVQWGKAAEQEGNTKSARIRYEYALDYLPDADWQRRLAATAGLAKALEAEQRPGDAAAAYEAVLPQIQNDHVRQQYALYLGRLYADRLSKPAKAAHWLNEADRGDADPLSLEAGYRWAEQQIAADHADAALERLQALARRGIKGTRWEVPIHYRLAVLHHQRKELKQALADYRIVAGVKDAEMRKLYPRSIEQSQQQARQIAEYLKASGGAQNDVAVPRIPTQ